MKANTVQTISFVQTKGGHTAGIINNAITVVKREGFTPLYNLYNNIAKGEKIPETPDLISEFTNAYFSILEAERLRIEEKQRQEREAENKRIEDLKKSVFGLTPQEVAERMMIDTVETAHHWNELYNGSSSFAFIITNNEDYEVIKIASEVNKWEGNFGELKNRAGEHHHEFNTFYDLQDYQQTCERHFNNDYYLRTKESESNWYFDQLKERIEDGEITNFEEVLDFVGAYNEMTEGYYDGNGNLCFEKIDFNNFFGYGEDVYSYNFGYRLPSKEIYYNGTEENEN